MANPDRRIYWWVGAGIAVLLLVGNQGFRQLTAALRDKHHVERVLAGLRADHQRLTRELGLITDDPAYSEYLVRKHLGYVKKGEVEYRLVKPGAKEPAAETRKPL